MCKLSLAYSASYYQSSISKMEVIFSRKAIVGEGE